MPPLHTRPCIYSQDKDRLIDLVRAYRRSTGVAIYPTTGRVRLLLTSRTWDPAQDTCLWECVSEQMACGQAGSGQIAALAFLWRRKADSPYLALERFIHPAFATRELAADLLAWGCRRAEAVASAQAGPLTLYAFQLAPSFCPGDAFDAYGFTRQKPHPEEFNLYFGRSLGSAISEPVLPPGYILRPANSLQELNALHAISSFAAVNPAHQQELFDSDEYCPLALVTPDSEIAAYCECSVDRAEWQVGSKTNEEPVGEAIGEAIGEAAGPRIGWIDYIETRPGQQGKGLGQAVLWAGLRRLQDWGADMAMLVTISSNSPAVHLYEKAGFMRVAVREPAVYEKHI